MIIMTALATSADMLVRYDENVVRDLLSDANTPVTATDLDDNARLTAILETASGYVLAAAIAGGNYTEAELSALTGNGAAMLQDLVCTIAVCKLMRRRPGRFKIEDIRSQEKDTEEWLNALRKGQRLFPIDSHVDASLPTIDGPTAVDYVRLNLITERTRNFFPSQAQRLPIGRG